MIFLNKTQIEQTIKGKIYKINDIKINTCCSCSNMTKKMNLLATNWKEIP